MHGNYRFSWPNAPLNHIVGRVKIVLGKKVDKYSVWISWEGGVSALPIPRPSGSVRLCWYHVSHLHVRLKRAPEYLVGWPRRFTMATIRQRRFSLARKLLAITIDAFMRKWCAVTRIECTRDHSTWPWKYLPPSKLHLSKYFPYVDSRIIVDPQIT